jgi:hypothetical protein
MGIPPSWYLKYSFVWGLPYLFPITIFKYFFGQENTISMFLQYMSHIQYVFSGSIVVPMWDLQTSKNFDSWFYSFDKWSWLCVIQYLVWWLILRYCYTYDIYKISLPEITMTFIFLCRFRICQFFKKFSATLFQASMPQHEQSVSVLKYKKHIVWL